jgi:hypothetical protein
MTTIGMNDHGNNGSSSARRADIVLHAVTA